MTTNVTWVDNLREKYTSPNIGLQPTTHAVLTELTGLHVENS